MDGSVLLTGANGSAGLHAAKHLLKTYPDLTVILTVRSTADTDVNTNNLRRVIAKYPNAKVDLHELDFADLTAVKKFTTTLKTDIYAGKYPPLKAIICNAFYWNLLVGPEFTPDGFDKTFQVNFISNFAIILRLLGSFSVDGGRINLVSSVAHYRRKNPLSPYIAGIPEDLDELVHPPEDPNKQGHGVLRYSNTKLVLTTWTYALNKYLEKDPKYRHITAVAQNPGDFQDSRAFQSNTPWILAFFARYIMTPLNFILRRLVDPTWRRSSEAGIDMVEITVNRKYSYGERGYYTLLKRDQPDEIVRDVQAQERVWRQAVRWAGVEQDECRLEGAFV